MATRGDEDVKLCCSRENPRCQIRNFKASPQHDADESVSQSHHDLSSVNDTSIGASIRAHVSSVNVRVASSQLIAHGNLK